MSELVKEFSCFIFRRKFIIFFSEDSDGKSTKVRKTGKSVRFETNDELEDVTALNDLTINEEALALVAVDNASVVGVAGDSRPPSEPENDPERVSICSNDTVIRLGPVNMREYENGVRYYDTSGMIPEFFLEENLAVYQQRQGQRPLGMLLPGERLTQAKKDALARVRKRWEEK